MEKMGYKSWFDVQMPRQDNAAMKEGVHGSECVLAIITGGDEKDKRCIPTSDSNPNPSE